MVNKGADCDMPENKPSFSFDHECICNTLPYIALETASSLIMALHLKHEHKMHEAPKLHHLTALRYNCPNSSLQSSFASRTSSALLLKCDAAVALSAFAASFESLSVLPMALNVAEMLEIVGDCASLPSGLLSDWMFCCNASRIS